MVDSDISTAPSTETNGSLREALAERVRAAVDAAEKASPQVRRVAVPGGWTLSPLDWIQAQRPAAGVYWSGRDSARTVAGVGTADVIRDAEVPVDYARLDRRLTTRTQTADPGARWYGGLRFDAPQPRAPDWPDQSWQAFGTYRFVLPRFEWVVDNGATALACNLVLPRDAERLDAILDAIDALVFPDATPVPDLPRPLGRADTPTQEGWTRMVNWALDAIGNKSLDKVVLARRVALDLGTPLDPLQVLQQLRGATENCFHFAVRPGDGPAFVGASPERLFRRRGRDVRSEAVAGTRSRGNTPAADAVLRDELFQSPKERREHAFVQQAIRAELERLCTRIDTPEAPGELVLSRSRHLHAPLSGTLQDGVGTVDLIEALHPTPAVGGVPQAEALAAIRTQEPFDRGWYAGPVGWVGTDAAEFTVGIRSGLVQEARLALFSGAGIVEGSVPEREWEEIEQKIGDFAAVLDLGQCENGEASHG
ncbi:MAG: isochorismate synthase MenF [Salinivenus sp.]